MIVAGCDEVGKNDYSQHDHISLVLGTEDAINSLHNDIGLKKIHMREFSDSKKNRVIKKLDFTKNNLFAMCLHVEGQKIIQDFMNSPKLKKKPQSKEQMHRYFDNILLNLIRNYVEPFCRKNGLNNIQYLRVQCDGGMNKTIQRWKMMPLSEGKAHQLADAVAWCNEHNRRVRGHIKKDFRNDIRKKMESLLFS